MNVTKANGVMTRNTLYVVRKIVKNATGDRNKMTKGEGLSGKVAKSGTRADRKTINFRTGPDRIKNL